MKGRTNIATCLPCTDRCWVKGKDAESSIPLSRSNVANNRAYSSISGELLFVL